DKRIGGIKIFGWNVSNLERLGKSIGTMQKKASENPLSIPLFIATDQEGGWVRHIKGKTSITPGNMSIGATSLPEDAYKTGVYIGQELKTLGINLNFAPTVDIYTNQNADVIGPRSFSSDPEVTAALSTSFFQGQDSTGVISTAKHFPGHGAAEGDSHGMLPIVNADFDTIWERELLPYRYLIKRGIPAIMSGHLAFPKITGDKVAASESKYFITELLRNKMGFKGIIITDDMVMTGALIGEKDLAEACYAAILAGNDIIMISRKTADYQKVWEYLFQKLHNNEDFRTIVINAVKRILKTKLSYFKREDAVSLCPDPDKIIKNIPSINGSKFFFDQAFRSVSLIKGENLPVKIDSESSVLLAGPYKAFLAEGKKQIGKASTYYFPFSPNKETEKRYIKDFKTTARDYDTVIFCLANRFGLEMLKTLKNMDTNVTVISTLTPVYLENTSWVKSAVAVYGTGYESFMAGFNAVLGAYTPTGIVPFSGLMEKNNNGSN
ncbi:MAG: glycoside hydrolase family 3 protein, partial [Spirochaetaceae bacterium]|nr:glycoside hydrolase family 3 protein [Spirochaetaceae bacterium]